MSIFGIFGKKKKAEQKKSMVDSISVDKIIVGNTDLRDTREVF
jgi:hypothetical protein